MNHYILKDKIPVPVESIEEWAQWFETSDRSVAFDEIGEVGISTVFLGLDRNWKGMRSNPVLFETMVFGGPMDCEQDRYCTWEEAEAGHQAMVNRVKEVSAREGE